jgi:hypothetical protein
VLVEVAVKVKLPPGSYIVVASVASGPLGERAAVSPPASVPFEVTADAPSTGGLAALDYRTRVRVRGRSRRRGRA